VFGVCGVCVSMEGTSEREKIQNIKTSQNLKREFKRLQGSVPQPLCTEEHVTSWKWFNKQHKKLLFKVKIIRLQNPIK
jgi:hypothetical protein